MSDFYTASQRQLQDEFNSRKLAARMEAAIVVDELSDSHIEFIAARNMFFLSTVDENGFPSCSYKGGAPGFIRVVNPGTLVFPNYDGNGMFMSQGNIEARAKVGLLFINFEIPQRIRLRGEAKLLREGPMLASYPGALSVTEVTVGKAWVNCGRYVHKMAPTKLSSFLPNEDGSYKFPPWKRVEELQDALTDADRNEANHLGLISAQEYAEMEAAGGLE